METVTVGPVRHELAVAKWERHRTPADGAPDETVVVVAWIDGDGTVIDDPERVAALERAREARSDGEGAE